MKNINYYGQKITVSGEVAEFLEQDRLRESVQRKSDQRHLDFVGNEIYTMPGLFSDTPKYRNNVYTIYSLENPEIYRDPDAAEDDELPLSIA